MRNKVLIIDDETIICELGQEMFEMLDYEAFIAYNLNDAVEIFTAHHNDIGLVILDLNLEGISGVEVYRKLLTIDDNINAVIASGEFLESDAPKYQAMGIKEILTKPYGIKDLQKLSTQFLQ